MEYKSSYLTDNAGKVLFPHNSIDEVHVNDGKNLRKSGVFHREGEDIKDIDVVRVQADYAENNPEAAGYIKNRPFYEEVVEEIPVLEGSLSFEEPEDSSYVSIEVDESVVNKILNAIDKEYYTNYLLSFYIDGVNYINELENEPNNLWATFYHKEQNYFYVTIRSQPSSISIGSYIYGETPTTHTLSNIVLIHKKIHKIDKNFILNDNNSYSENSHVIATGNYSHAEGYDTKAKGNWSHAEGWCSETFGLYSHAEGFRTQSSSFATHTEGEFTLALDYDGHAEGTCTTAFAAGAHSEGRYTIAVGVGSHAEGGYYLKTYQLSKIIDINENFLTFENATNFEYIQSKISGLRIAEMILPVRSFDIEKCQIEVSFSNLCTIPGKSDRVRLQEYLSIHDKPMPTTATLYREASMAFGSYSHSEGQVTNAAGSCSHSEGLATVAAGNNQHVQGKWNIKDNSSVHIVGWGSETTQKNIHTLSTNGTAWFQGDVYVGSTGGKNRDEGSKKLVANGDATITIGNTTINETQLQALLALLN